MKDLTGNILLDTSVLGAPSKSASSAGQHEETGNRGTKGLEALNLDLAFRFNIIHDIEYG